MPSLDRQTRAALPCEPRRVGMLACWGRYPLLVAEALNRAGYRTYCLGARGLADPRLADLCHDFRWLGWASFGRAIRYFKRHQVRHVTMAGKFHKVALYEPGVWLRNLPDWRTIRCFWGCFVSRSKDRRDDTLLTAIIDEFARDGITFGPATDYAPELLVNAGQMTQRAPTRAQWKDIRFGWEMAKEMGRLDIGQSVCIKDQATLAVEAIEGTDECIRRGGALCKSGGFTVVKVAKPQQDMRFDVPTIGTRTLQTMIDAGARVLAVEAGRTIVLDEPEVVRFADHHKLAIVALDAAEAFTSNDDSQAA